MPDPEAAPELVWRIEHACFNAWPALEQTEFGGWLLRAANGISRRANSANPLLSNPDTLDAVLPACAGFFHARNLSVVLRLPSFVVPAIHERALELHYRPEGETLVMHMPIESAHAQPDPTVEIASAPGEEWFAAMSRLQRYATQKYQSYRRLVGLIAVPAGYALVRHRGQAVAVAYGAIHDKLLVFESVVTDQAHRGQGHASRMLAGLIAWGRAAGAEGVCLQVQADNRSAVALYTGLGLEPLYRYRYLREPG